MEIIEKENRNGTVILDVSGRMDAVSAPEFEKAVTDRIDQGHINFIVDFSGLTYISSAGLRSILAPAKRLRGVKGNIALASLQDTVKKVFQISGVGALIPLYDSVESAVDNRK